MLLLLTSKSFHWVDESDLLKGFQKVQEIIYSIISQKGRLIMNNKLKAISHIMELIRTICPIIIIGLQILILIKLM